MINSIAICQHEAGKEKDRRWEVDKGSQYHVCVVQMAGG